MTDKTMRTPAAEGEANASTQVPSTYTRRDVMRRGVVLGGAFVWAAPAVQSMARPAFAHTPESAENYSVFAVIVCGPDGEGPYRAKYDAGDDGTFGWDDGQASGIWDDDCIPNFSETYRGAEGLGGDFVSILGFPVENETSVTFDLASDDYTLVAAAVKEGTYWNAGESEDGSSISLDIPSACGADIERVIEECPSENQVDAYGENEDEIDQLLEEQDENEALNQETREQLEQQPEGDEDEVEAESGDEEKVETQSTENGEGDGEGDKDDVKDEDED